MDEGNVTINKYVDDAPVDDIKHYVMKIGTFLDVKNQVVVEEEESHRIDDA